MRWGYLGEDQSQNGDTTKKAPIFTGAFFAIFSIPKALVRNPEQIF